MRELIKLQDQVEIADSMFSLIEELYPICRSITGDGVRETLSIVRKIIPLQVHEIPSGTQVFDWTVPKEWNIKAAHIKNAKGEIVVDFSDSNLHVVNYSVPVHRKMSLQELKKHCHTLPDHPEWIPYRTSYYNETWGFCLTHSQFASLPDGEYEVFIDSSLESGSLTYGEYFVKGETETEILIYSHICHPSLCNDNLSGIALVSHLAKLLSTQSLKYSYRFVLAPGTIGSITWLSQNEHLLANIKYGLVVALVGDSGPLTYKKSRLGASDIDRAVSTALKDSKVKYNVIDFSPYGYDERQFCSPGINLPLGRLTRTPNACYPEYHSSADNLDFIGTESLYESFTIAVATVNILEGNDQYINTNPKCEPQLGKRGLYGKTGGKSDPGRHQLAMLWVLNLSDGKHALLDIAAKSEMHFQEIHRAARDLYQADLLRIAN